jgi:hypothetical protein
MGDLKAVWIAVGVPSDLIDIQYFALGLSGRDSSAVPLKSESLINPEPFIEFEA